MTRTDALVDELERIAGSFAIHLRTRNVARAAETLRGVAEVVRRTTSEGVVPPRVSPVALLPDGPVVRLDDLPSDRLTRRRLADAVEQLVSEAGLAPDAAVVCEVDGLADLDVAARAAVLRLFPEPAGSAGRLPASWIDLAAEWVFGDQDPETMVRLRVLGVESSVMAKEAAGVLHGCARTRAWCDVVTGDVASRLRTASISFGIAPHVAVAAGGPRCDDGGLLARFELLADVARDHAAAGRGGDRVAYACLDLEDGFGDLGTGLSASDWAEQGGAPPNRVAGRLVDRWVPDAYPFQILGPRHVERLGDRGGGGLEPLGDDRWALSLGEPEDWLPTSPVRAEVRAAAWRRVKPLLLAEQEMEAALAEVAVEVTGPAPREPAGDELWDAGLPDLSAVVIEPHSHPRRGTRLSVLELAAWLAGEPHSDDPVNVAPVLRVYVRELAAGLDDDRRQALRHRAAALAGTGGFDEGTERRRCWLLADRLLRVHAASWLDVAGLTESAERLRGLSSIEHETQLVRGVHLLGRAVTTASRRLEISQRIAAGHIDEVDALSWDLWEEVAQRTGWAATAEAVVHGVPGGLTFATDQRVMELSRDVEQRAELEGSTRSLGDEIWATALAEVAAAGWRSGWEVAEEYVRHETTFSFRTTLRRSLQEMLGDDDVALDLVLEDVDRAARDTIARLLLVGDDRSDHWNRALAAAVSVDGGDVWRRALDDACGVLGESLCEEALQAGREQLRGWVAAAPALVSRAVVSSVTREACSVAGRGLISRLAADVLNRGGSEAEAEAAAREVLTPLVEQLADDALAALDELVDLP